MTEIKRSCMRDHIRDVLVARILDGSYAPGTQLKELVLAREFNVSQAPIREALRELEGSGLVTSERYRGTRVREADFDEMRESYELRILLEVRSIELTAPYSADAMNRLMEYLKEMSAAAAAEDRERYIDKALCFHRQLVEASGNRTFLTVWDSLHWDVRARVVLRRLADKVSELKPLIGMHQTLLDALRAGDIAGAVTKLREISNYVSASFETRQV